MFLDYKTDLQNKRNADVSGIRNHSQCCEKKKGEAVQHLDTKAEFDA